ncbi:polyprenyl synthetase family protein [Streptomyces sp. NPDC051133]|uniref:polyprenyl synthetase family protein n=1 Tax=Streptomyces sp. NPDC051133 TaxID=3155521 RepID=UPI00343B4D4E
MPGARPTVAERSSPVDGLLTARDAVQAVETELRDVLDEVTRRTRDVDALFARDVADRVAALVGRGGKRLRTAFAWCGWRAAGGSGDAAAVVRAGCALELVQACALIHDDLMDGSPLRRGAPAIHVDLARMHRTGRMSGPAEAFANGAAVLAGDLALTWADDLMTEMALGSPHGRQLHREWQAMRAEMVAGQYRDLRAQATGASGVEEALAIATLKSALYTAERPLALGASLADAGASVVQALRCAGRCAGLAFQLRDDLLGAFGDPAMTGKPAADDLRTRKLTYLLAVGVRLAGDRGDEEATAVLAPRAADRPGATVEDMRAALERVGARTAVESKIKQLAASSLRHFAETGAGLAVREEFTALVQRAAGVVPGHTGEAA